MRLRDISCPRSDTPASIAGQVQRISLSLRLNNELEAAKTPLERIAREPLVGRVLIN